MHITLSELVGFERVSLNNIEHLKYQPTQPYQLILGTNGCGKSSVMRRLTPWPADKDDFTEEGYEAFETNHEGSHYRLTAEYRKKQAYSFIKNGEELNLQSTVTVQKILVTQEFKIDQDLNDFMFGEIRLTQLKPLERRKWFTRLSEANYDYAIGLYKKLSTQMRDIQGSLRRAKANLVTETEKALSEEETDRLTKELAELEKEFDYWSGMRRPATDDTDHGKIIDNGLNLLSVLVSRILRTNFNIPGSNVYTSPSQVQEKITELRGEIGVLEGQLGIYVKQYDNVNKLVTELQRVSAEGVQALQARLPELQQQRDDAFKAQRLQLVFRDPKLAKSALETIRESVVGILMELPPNEDRRYSGRKLEEKRVNRMAAVAAVENHTNALNRAMAFKAQADAHKERGATTCPKCHFVWVEGYSDKQYAANEEHIAGLELDIANARTLVADYELEIEGILNYSKLYQELNRITTTWDVLDPFWKLMLKDGLLFSSPVSCANLLLRLAYDIDFAIQVEVHEQALTVLREQIASALAVGDADLEEALDEQAMLEAEVNNITDGLTTKRSELDKFSTYLGVAMNWEKAGAEIAALVEQIADSTLEQLEMCYQFAVESHLARLMRVLVIKREALREATVQRKLLGYLAEQIERETLDEAALQELCRELSPTEGLIAEGLFGFIKNFTGQMNSLIKRIWSYPLAILPCGSEGELGTELNYKFPLRVGDRSKPVPDVARGSSGQKEIVDLAFKVVGMRFAGLSKFPLYLDEFAASFDEAHRAAAMSAIKTLMEQSSFSQLFMVSHYEGNHGTLTNAEVMVLCDLNISVPSVYNTHVQIL